MRITIIGALLAVLALAVLAVAIQTFVGAHQARDAKPNQEA